VGADDPVTASTWLFILLRFWREAAMTETCILLLFMVASPTKLNETWNQTNPR